MNLFRIQLLPMALSLGLSLPLYANSPATMPAPQSVYPSLPEQSMYAPIPQPTARTRSVSTAERSTNTYGYPGQVPTGPAYAPMPGDALSIPPMNGDYSAEPYAYPAYPYVAPGYGDAQWMPNQASQPFGGLGRDFLSGENPFTNPVGNDGYWANPNFRPWRSGPFERKRWGNHPMNNMPWGNFPGWGDGFFGGFGPDNWEGITPWGNNVPFRWIDPAEPRESIANMWDDAINTPNSAGRMPPGWTAPYISVPNPVDVADEFERNARNFPEEMNKMIDIGEDD